MIEPLNPPAVKADVYASDFGKKEPPAEPEPTMKQSAESPVDVAKRARKPTKPRAKKTPKQRKEAKPKPAPKAKRGPRGFVSDYRGELVCKFGDFQANGKLVADGLVVFKGSYANLTVNKTALKKTPGRFNQRNALIEDGTLAKEGKSFVFTKDHTFASLSAAAIALVGLPVNGLQYWRTKDGKKLNEL